MAEASKKQFPRGIILRADDVALVGISGELKIGLTSKELEVYLDGAARSVVTKDQVQSLSNKNLIDSSTAFVDSADPTKKIVLDAAGTSGTSTTIVSSQTANQTITLPNASTTLVGTTETATVTNKTIVVANNIVTTAPSGNLTSTNLNSALAELQGDIDNLGATKQNNITGAATSITTANLTASRALISDASGKVAVSTGVTAAELEFIGTLTSNAQTQIDGKEPNIANGTSSQLWQGDKTWVEKSALPISSATQSALDTKQANITGAATTITSSNLTTSRALVSDGTGKVGVSAVTSIELGHVSGVTSGIQSQIDSKQATITGAASSITSSNLTTSRALVSDGSGKVSASSVTSTQLGYVDATSSIQTQLNAKAPLASPALTGTPTAPTATAGTNTTQLATTAFVTAANTGKEGSISPGTTSQYWRGDKTWQDTSGLPISTATQSALDDKVEGPASATNEAIARFDGTTGKLVKSGTGTITAAGSVAGLTGLSTSGTATFSGIVVNSANTTNTQTGPNVNISNATTAVTRLTGAISSVGGYAVTTAGRRNIIINASGNPVTIINEDTSITATNRIVTGAGGDIVLKDGASIEMIYNSSTQRHQVIGGIGGESGSGQGGINYINNHDFEIGTSGWSLYNDGTSAEAPIDGVGGTISSVSFTDTAPTALRGAKSGYLNKTSTANRRGYGVATDFTINEADKTKICNISFDYSSGGNYADGFCTVYVYDVTNASVIHLVNRDIAATDRGTYTGSFQASSNSTSFRLMVHVATDSVATFTLTVDNVKVAPAAPRTTGQVVVQQSSYILNASSISASNPVTGALTTQSGSSSLYSYNSGTGQYTALRNIWVTATAAAAATSSTPGMITIYLNGSVVAHDGTNNSGSGWAASVTWTGYVAAGSNFNAGVSTGTLNNHRVSVSATYVSDNVVLSEDAGTREVVAKIRRPSNQSFLNGSITKVTFSTTEIDTTSSVDLTNNRINVPESGHYDVHGEVVHDMGGSASRISLYVRKNGLGDNLIYIQSAGNINGNSGASLSGVLYLQKGDYVELYAAQESGATRNQVDARLTIAKRSSPQTIAATETVAARLSNSAGTAIGTSFAALPYPTKEKDTHNAWDTSTHRFTAPVSGSYRITGLYQTQTVSIAVASGIFFAIHKNGSLHSYASIHRSQNSTSHSRSENLLGQIDMVKGDYFQIFSLANTATNLVSDATVNWLYIERISN